MKSKLLITTFILGFASRVLADASNADMPMLYADKCTAQKSIQIPPGLEGTAYFFNRDCTVAFIVPPPTGTMEMENPAVFENMRLCDYVNANLTSLVKIGQLKEKISSSLLEMDLSDPRFETLKSKLKSLSETEELLSSNKYSELPGMTIQVRLKSSLTSDYLEAIRKANSRVITENGVEKMIPEIEIRPAPVDKGFVSFNAMMPGTTKSFSGNPVLESNIMGILTKADESNQTRTSVRFNGAAEGYITLSLNGACPLMQGDFTRLNELKLNKERASSFLTVTNTMVVPALTSFGYKAKVNVLNATDILLNEYKTNTPFSVSRVKDSAIWGKMSQAVTVSSWTFEDNNGNLQSVYNDLIKSDNLDKAKQFVLKSLLEKLTTLSVLSEVKSIDAPAAGNETRTGNRHVCSDKTFLGVRYSKECHDETYQFQVAVNGQASIVDNIKNHLGLDFTDEVEFLHPTTRTFTSVFKIQGDK